ncbi:hypothetical protein [Cerasicoccus frondis]|uniref:RraA family protein n=1 Tax=Cerasicoccus frondis TaxID=490090 RepID=UPI0028525F90|nr:hypothetical protein [Cerasicoccus frondis]
MPDLEKATFEAEKPPSIRLYSGPGNRIRRNIQRPPESDYLQLLQFDPTTVSDIMNRIYSVGPGFQCQTPNRCSILGPACTINCFPGDNLMVQKSLDIARPGDILVINAKGLLHNAMVGDMITTKAQQRGIRGIIVDGAIRDQEGIAKLGLPVFARGRTTAGPLHRGPGEINFPIALGGVVVNPGDIVYGNASGLVVIPQDDLHAVLKQLLLSQIEVKAYEEKVRKGAFKSEWVDRVLEDNGCAFE